MSRCVKRLVINLLFGAGGDVGCQRNGLEFLTIDEASNRVGTNLIVCLFGMPRRIHARRSTASASDDHLGERR